MALGKYLKSLIQKGTPDSAKSFALVVSVVVGFLLGLCICFILVYDVLANGYLKTDLTELGFFLLCISGYVAGSGVNEALADRYKAKFPRTPSSQSTVDTEKKN